MALLILTGLARNLKREVIACIVGVRTEAARGPPFRLLCNSPPLAAVISYFWRDIWDIVSGSLSAIARRDYYDRSFGLAVGIVIGTIPIGIAGLALAKTLNTCGSPLRSLT